jgi:hypothetical protein
VAGVGRTTRLIRDTPDENGGAGSIRDENMCVKKV